MVQVIRGIGCVADARCAVIKEYVGRICLDVPLNEYASWRPAGQMVEVLLYLESGSHADALHLATAIST